MKSIVYTTARCIAANHKYLMFNSGFGGFHFVYSDKSEASLYLSISSEIMYDYI